MKRGLTLVLASLAFLVTIIAAQPSYARPYLDRMLLKNEGDQITYNLGDWEYMSDRGRLNGFLTDSELTYEIFTAIVKDEYLGIEASYRGGKVVSRFVFPRDTISPNQLGQEDLENEIELFYKTYGEYRGSADTFHESVKQLYDEIVKLQAKRAEDAKKEELAREAEKAIEADKAKKRVYIDLTQDSDSDSGQRPSKKFKTGKEKAD